MKINTYAVKVNDETVDYIERLGYEVEASKRIIKEIITENADTPVVLEGETFKYYNDKFEKNHAAFEIAKDELQKEYIPDEVKTAVQNWSLDYKTGILTYTVAEE